MASDRFAWPEQTENQATPWLTHNDANQDIEDAIAGVFDIDVSAGGTIAPSLADFRDSRVLRLTGSPGAGFTLQLPNVQREFAVWNVSGQTATVQQSASPGTTVNVATATYSILFASGSTLGNNVVKAT